MRSGQENVFGEYLRRLRVEAGYGLREFARVVGFQASNLSAMEHGRLRPPRGPDMLARIASPLGIRRGSEAWDRLHDLAAVHPEPSIPADVADFAAGKPGISRLLRTVEQRRLTAAELDDLAAHVRRRYKQTRRESSEGRDEEGISP